MEHLKRNYHSSLFFIYSLNHNVRKGKSKLKAYRLEKGAFMCVYICVSICSLTNSWLRNLKSGQKAEKFKARNLPTLAT
jgi:hypothetical protein